MKSADQIIEEARSAFRSLCQSHPQFKTVAVYGLRVIVMAEKRALAAQVLMKKYSDPSIVPANVYDARIMRICEMLLEETGELDEDDEG